MTDVLEQKLREALSEQAAQIDRTASTRLRAIDYRPRRLRVPSRPAIGLTGLAGATAAVGAVIALGSSAAPAFAGWRASPTTPLPGQLAQAAQACQSQTGSPVLTDTRGPYTAEVFATQNGAQLCLSGNNMSVSSTTESSAAVSVAAGQVELDGTGLHDSDGNALTVVYGRIGSGVTGVTIDRSDGSSVQATVTNGWYLAWWPGSQSATTADVASASGTTDQVFPQQPAQSGPPCPTGARCAGGYSFGGNHGSVGGSGGGVAGGPAGAGQGSVTTSSSVSTVGAVGSTGSGATATGNSGQ